MKIFKSLGRFTVAAVLAGAVVSFPHAGGSSTAFWLARDCLDNNPRHWLLAVLVVATPCPLILAVPVAIVAGMSRCAKRGVLIKGGGMLEKLAQAKTLFFDKTGTLTGGRARLVATEAVPELGAAELLRIAASLDQVSQHVIAQAIVTAAHDRDLALSMPSGVEERPGAGLTGVVDNRRVAVGGYAFVCASAPPADWSHRFLQRMGYDGATGVFVAIDGVMAGALLLHDDEIRAETPRAPRLLRKAGVERIVMLTGDRHDVAETFRAGFRGAESRTIPSPGRLNPL